MTVQARHADDPAPAVAGVSMPSEEKVLADLSRGDNHADVIGIDMHCDQLRVDFNLKQFFFLTAGIAVLVIIVVSNCIEGVRVTSYDGILRDDAKLMMYNTLSGILASVFTTGVGLVLSPIVAVLMLCFFPKLVVKNGSGNTARAIVVGILSVLVCNGPHSLNVQLSPQTSHIRILAEDLSTQHLHSMGSQYTNSTAMAWDQAFSESASNNEVANTIFRSAYVSTKILKSSCSRTLDPIDAPLPSFRYSPIDWHIEALPTALTPAQKLALLPTDSLSDSIDVLPTDVTTARTLFSTALIELYDQFGGQWSSEKESFADFVKDSRDPVVEQWGGVDTSAAENPILSDLMAFAGDNFVGASRDMLRRLFAQAPTIVADAVEAEFASFQLSESMGYTSLTLSIPILPQDSADGTQSLETASWCSKDGCYLPNASDIWGGDSLQVEPGVRVSALCPPSAAADASQDKSNCSLLLVSIGKRIIGDVLDFDADLNEIVASGLRMKYTITVGLLSWEIEDLAAVYNAECGITANMTEGYSNETISPAATAFCTGIGVATAPFNAARKVALLHQSELFFSELEQFTDVLAAPYSSYSMATQSKWKKVVNIGRSPPILLPRNFDQVTETTVNYLPSIDGALCSLNVDQFIKTVLNNHLYAEQSLQMSYKAAFHYVMQNAVVHTMFSSDKGWLVDFLGSKQSVSVAVAIPNVNGSFSLIGCIVLVLTALAITVSARRSKRDVEAMSSSATIAEAMVNSNTFPGIVLGLWLDQVPSDGGKRRRVALSRLEFENIHLVDKFAVRRTFDGPS